MSNIVLDHIVLTNDYEYLINGTTSTDLTGLEEYIKSCKNTVSEKNIVKTIKVKIGDIYIPLYKLKNEW